jgi:hypothetical protein
MNKGMACFGASVVALWATTFGAEAKKVYYEIDGVRYSYSTNNRQQVREARERINAANAADAAKAKAQAERAANPLAALFGSPAQTAAKEAESRVKQIASRPAGAASGSAETEVAPQIRRERRRAARETHRAEPAEAARAAAPTRPIRAAVARTPAPASKAAVKEPSATGAPAVKSVFYDLSSGIKTVHMSDGTVHEELFDTGNPPSLGSGAADGNLTDFVNGLRKPAPEDATGTLPKLPAHAQSN